MCQTVEDLKAKAHWDGAEGNSRHNLLSHLSGMSLPLRILLLLICLSSAHIAIGHVT